MVMYDFLTASMIHEISKEKKGVNPLVYGIVIQTVAKTHDWISLKPLQTIKPVKRWRTIKTNTI